MQVTYHTQLADLMLLLGFDMFSEYMAQQRALALVFQKLLWLHGVLLLPALSGKCHSMSCGTERQQ